MKIMVASDIHGSAYYCRKLVEEYKNEKADKLILLGDLLYHGPRNELPREYDPKQVIRILNTLKNDILCVRGNCDGEVDQTVLEFPILSEYGFLHINGKTLYLVHGHKLDENNILKIKKGEFLLYGHTHVPKAEEKDGYAALNPGSVSIPKEGSAHGYMIIEEKFQWKDFDGNIYMEY